MNKLILTAGFVLTALWTIAQERLVLDPNAEVRNVASFHGVSASGSIDVYISEGEQNVAISAADKKDLENIITEVKDGVLQIRFKDSKGWWSDHWNTVGRKFKAYVSARQIDYISLSGSGNVHIEGVLKTPKLKFQISGSGNISGAVETKDLFVKQSGSSNIKLSGSATNAEFVCSGSGNINSPELETEVCQVKMSGSGNADLTVNKSLSAATSGSGNIRYRGTGNLVNSSSSGSGRIRKIS